MVLKGPVAKISLQLPLVSVNFLLYLTLYFRWEGFAMAVSKGSLSQSCRMKL